MYLYLEQNQKSLVCTKLHFLFGGKWNLGKLYRGQGQGSFSKVRE